MHPVPASWSQGPPSAPPTPIPQRALLLGSGELGKEVAIELQRLGCEVIAVDRYANAPAMQVAHRSHVIDMLDGSSPGRDGRSRSPTLSSRKSRRSRPDAGRAGKGRAPRVMPTARAAWLTMDREGIRRLAAEELGIADLALTFRRQRSPISRCNRALGCRA